MSFPSFKEFKESLNPEDVGNDKFDFYCEHCDWDSIYDRLSDYTNEKIGEDEQEWVGNLPLAELWKEMLKSHMRFIEKKLRNKVPFDVVKKYLKKEEIDEWDRLKKMEFVEKI